ncbi:MAG: hypothetical protein IMZ73_12095 [Chloroflexi bacterium]|nr:hypothetical protein [Chloroflexota bacterium]
MSRKKLDGVIEAVHYTTGGKIAVVRAYERHGVVWSDHVLLERKELSERLKQGKRFVVGERKIYFGSIFETGTAVHQIEGNIITEGQTSSRDHLTGVPVF